MMPPEHKRNGDPDLTLHGILGGAKKGFDQNMLFDPFEKELLPSITYRDRLWSFWNDEVAIGQKVESGLAAVMRNEERWTDRISVHWNDSMGVSAFVLGIALGPNDEEASRV